MAQQPKTPDAIVVGSGPNGLAAAITLARAGRAVRVLEAEETVGGGIRSMELTLPGIVHDICSAIYPMAICSPFFRSLPLEEYGLRWIESPVQLAHPFDDGTAAVLMRSIEETADSLGEDAAAYRALMGPLVADIEPVLGTILGPLRPPRHPIAALRFGLPALRSAAGFAASRFTGAPARGLFGGIAAHSILPLDALASAAIGLVLGMVGHAYGWPAAAGGSGRIADALVACLRSYGGEIEPGVRVTDLDALPLAKAVLFDVTPRQLLDIAGDKLPGWYRWQLGRFRHGPGIFKVDWALEGPIPWRVGACGRAATVHLGGTLEEIAAGEAAVARGGHPERPFVLLAQQSLFDPSRVPEGMQAVWGYCHVPNGSTVDMTARIEAQIERFAPGFRDRILARHTAGPVDLERRNANYFGGDIVGGMQDLCQIIARPAPRWNPYTTPNRRIYLCSSSTPPGGGVHGMCGFHAARAALRRAW
ncbi:MAG: phytoene desaturase family protein [Thermomicrobiales bacterium]